MELQSKAARLATAMFVGKSYPRPRVERLSQVTSLTSTPSSRVSGVCDILLISGTVSHNRLALGTQMLPISKSVQKAVAAGVLHPCITLEHASCATPCQAMYYLMAQHTTVACSLFLVVHQEMLGIISQLSVTTADVSGCDEERTCRPRKGHMNLTALKSESRTFFDEVLMESRVL